MGEFLQLFDRNHILAGKRLYARKRLPHFTVPDDVSESNKFVASPAVSKELRKPQPRKKGRGLRGNFAKKLRGFHWTAELLLMLKEVFDQGSYEQRLQFYQLTEKID